MLRKKDGGTVRKFITGTLDSDRFQISKVKSPLSFSEREMDSGDRVLEGCSFLKGFYSEPALKGRRFQMNWTGNK